MKDKLIINDVSVKTMIKLTDYLNIPGAKPLGC